MNALNSTRTREAVPTPRDALILAIDDATLRIGQQFLRLLGNDDATPIDITEQGAQRGTVALDWPLLVAGGTGGALRLIHHVQPKGVFVCVGYDQLAAAALLIETIRRRRAGLPQVALAGEHDPRIERGVRLAGANYYFPLAGRFDRDLIGSAMNAIGIGPAPPSSGRPERSRAAPAPPEREPVPQARGRPPTVLG
jgi:hypothetical protein